MCRSPGSLRALLILVLFAGLLLGGCRAGSGGDSTPPEQLPPVTDPGDPGDPTDPDPGTPPPPVDPGDDVFLNVVPPGSRGNSTGNIQGEEPLEPILGEVPHFQDQLRLYEELAFSPPNLQASPCNPPTNTAQHAASDRSQVCSHFKQAGLTPDLVTSQMAQTNPRTGGVAIIQRDGWGVPFVNAETRDDAMFGVGFASAQDRLFLHDALRHVGRGRLSEFLGPESSFFDFDVDIANVAGYSDAEMTRMVERARALFNQDNEELSLGDLMIEDIDNLVAGINAYLDYLQTEDGLAETPLEYATLTLPNVAYPPRRWNRNDIVASAILIQSIFAVGGGGEHLNLLQLQQTAANDGGSFGPGDPMPVGACELWRDLRHATDPDTPQTSERSFATQSPPVLNEDCPQSLPAGAAIWDPGSFQTRPTLVVEDLGIPVVIPQLPDIVGIDLSPLGELITPFLSPLGGLLGEFGGNLCTPAQLPLIGGICLGHRDSDLTDLLLAFARPTVKDSRQAAPFIPQRSIRQASLEPIAGARRNLCAAGLCLPDTMSNFLGVSAEHTADGFPIAVMGPQAGYFLPQLLWEVSVVSGGDSPGPLDFAGRGVVFGNLPYINIGRGLDFAWSATSGNSDLTDVRVSRVCSNGEGYLYDGECRAFDQRTDEWFSSPTVASVASGGSPTLHRVERRILRTHYGPVFATATVDGEPVVVSLQRSTFFGELDTAPPFALASTRGIRNFDDFRKVFNSVTGTFNWLYADAEDIAWFHSGLYPRRHPEHHPELPVWGDGRFEWQSMQSLPADFFDATPYPNPTTTMAQGHTLEGFFEWPGFLNLEEHPQEINPPKGFFTSWNNNPARDWWAADANGSYGPIHRADMLEARMKAFAASGRLHDIASVTEIMSDAAHTDLRGQEMLIHALDLLRLPGDPSNDPLSQDDLDTVIELMQEWLDDGSMQWISMGAERGLGAYRRDRNRDGRYDHRAQVVLMDAWYESMIPHLVPQVEALGNLALQGRYDAPGAIGSAYQNGWYEMIYAVLAQTLQANDGIQRTPTVYRRLRCAGVEASIDDAALVNACRDALLQSLDQALTRLGGLDNRSNWDGSVLYQGNTVENNDAIRHTAISAGDVPPMHWSNRPTFQQVVQVRNRRE